MSWFGSLIGNEVSHLGNLFGNFGIKNAEQMVLGAADPLSAKLWGGITGQHFTPMVGQLGGETGAQYAQSDAQGVNTGPARFMGGLANMIAGAEAGSYFGGGGGLFTAGANALDGNTPASAAAPGGMAMPGIGSGSSPVYPSTGAAGFDSVAPQGQSPQQRLAVALMARKSASQGTPLDNLSALSNKTMALHMMQQAPGGDQ